MGSAAARLDEWMEWVLSEGRYTSQRITEPGLKKTRTSLRRARSVAEVMRLLDPDATWEPMRVQARDLFRQLGPLRDLHVLRTWVKALMPEGDVVGEAYQRLLSHRERKERAQVKEALERFDWHAWEAHRSALVPRLAHVDPRDLAVLQVALERWEEALALHHQVQRDAPARVWHELRKAVKRFRYVLECFEPELYEELRPSLKKVQAALGELHDVDVLGDELMAIMPLFGPEPRKTWRALLRKERTARVVRYRSLTAEDTKDSLLAWRLHLPEGGEAVVGALHRLSRMFHDGRVDERALDLGIMAAGVFSHFQGVHPFRRLDRARTLQLVRAAAVLLDVAKKPKAASRRIRKLAPPTPYSAQDLEEVALIVRYAKGRPPRHDDGRLVALQRSARDRVEVGAATLRLVLGFERTFGSEGVPGGMSFEAALPQIDEADTAPLLLLLGGTWPPGSVPSPGAGDMGAATTSAEGEGHHDGTDEDEAA